MPDRRNFGFRRLHLNPASFGSDKKAGDPEATSGSPAFSVPSAGNGHLSVDHDFVIRDLHHSSATAGLIPELDSVDVVFP